MKVAIEKAQEGEYEAFVAVGGGSVLRTAKVARLFDRYPEAVHVFNDVNRSVLVHQWNG